MKTLSDKLKDFEGLVKTKQDTVPYKAVRKLYKLALELSDRVKVLESSKKVVEQVAEPLRPFGNEKILTDQIREMTKEVEGLKKEIEELKSDKWYTPLWHK